MVLTLPPGWPAPSKEGVVSHIAAYCGTPRVFGLSEAHAQTPLKKGLFHLQVGQSLIHSGKMSTYADGLNVILSKEAVFIHPDDAEQIGIAEGESVELSCQGQGETVRVPVVLSRRLSRGTLFFPEHFSLEIKKGLPFAIDPVTHVPYGDYGVVGLSKAAAFVS